MMHRSSCDRSTQLIRLKRQGLPSCRTFICSGLFVILLPAAISKITFCTLAEGCIQPHTDDGEAKWHRNSCNLGGGNRLFAKRLMKSCSGGSRLVHKSNCWNSSTNTGDTGVAMASLEPVFSGQHL